MNVVPDSTIVYQLHVLLLGISPAIWRRLLVRADSTIADLHAVLQLAMGWSDVHLNAFFIRGDHYGVPHPGGMQFYVPSDAPLSNFQFRPGERFRYDYDFGADWQHQVRVEKLLLLDPARNYPLCTGGRRCCPPEDMAGPDAYMEYQEGGGATELFDRLESALTYPDDVEVDTLGHDCLDVLNASGHERFDRRSVNHKLRRYADGEPLWELVEPY